MNELLIKIAELDQLSQGVLRDKIFDSGHAEDFLIVLKNASEETRNKILGTYPKRFSEWIIQEMNKIGEIDDERAKLANAAIQGTFEGVALLVETMNKNTENIQESLIEKREVLKADFVGLSKHFSDQQKGLEMPVARTAPENAELIDLPTPNKNTLKKTNLFDCIIDRESKRKFTEENLTLEELSWLLFSTQGVKRTVFDDKVTFRTAPSGGARHPFETFLAIQHVEGLEKGLYLYIAPEHKLLFLNDGGELERRLIEAALGQQFVGKSAVCFMWSVIPYRTEWRYTTEAVKIILQDIGHVCQNLYLACESIEAGTCAIGAYNQEKFDDLLLLDGKSEMVVYVAPVGKLPKEEPKA